MKVTKVKKDYLDNNKSAERRCDICGNWGFKMTKLPDGWGVCRLCKDRYDLPRYRNGTAPDIVLVKMEAARVQFYFRVDMPDQVYWIRRRYIESFPLSNQAEVIEIYEKRPSAIIHHERDPYGRLPASYGGKVL